MKKYIVGISGASGTIIGISLVREILKSSEVHLIITDEALSILKTETGINWIGCPEEQIISFYQTDRLFLHSHTDFYCPVASGSFKTDGMFVVPCSMKTLAAIANGYGSSLIERAADVTLKEGRRLLLSPREMPFSAIHLENMLKLSRLGVIIAPPVPAFYYGPKSLEDMLSFYCGKMLDAMGIDNELFKRWGGNRTNALRRV